MATATPPAHHQTPLSDVDISRMHDDDMHAARIVVGLITGVFTTGLILYSVICWVASLSG
jgi:hypothetical protein